MHEQTGNTPTLLEAIASEIKKGEALGIGSPRASLESNFALRALVGEDNFYHGVPVTHFDLMNLSLRILQECTVLTPSLRSEEHTSVLQSLILISYAVFFFYKFSFTLFPFRLPYFFFFFFIIFFFFI